jgi:histidine phosphotransfer protein HptB
MTDPLIIDAQAIENLRALNPGDGDGFLREITGMFLSDTPLRLVELDQSLAEGDVSRFTRAAHSIKGSSANLGAAALHAAAERLEHQARTHGLVDVEPLMARVKAEFSRANDALTALLGK